MYEALDFLAKGRITQEERNTLTVLAETEDGPVSVSFFGGAGCPEEQAEAMVDLVSRAPLNARIARSLDQQQLRLDSIESGMATQAALETLTLRVESIKAGMATKSDLKVLGAETKAALKDLRSEMFRMIWIQSGVLGTLILGLATIMVSVALF